MIKARLLWAILICSGPVYAVEPRIWEQDTQEDFLKGEIYYPEEVGLFEVLDRMDLKSYRQLEPCCKTQIGFIESLLNWADECWPHSRREALELEEKMRESLADETAFLRRQALKSQAALERAALLA